MRKTLSLLAALAVFVALGSGCAKTADKPQAMPTHSDGQVIEKEIQELKSQIQEALARAEKAEARVKDLEKQVSSASDASARAEKAEARVKELESQASSVSNAPARAEKPEASEVQQMTSPDLSKAPAKFRDRLAAAEKEIQEKGGFAVAGQVEDEGELHPAPGQFAVALKYNEANAYDTYKFIDGWFVSRAMSEGQSRYNKLVVASFNHLPVEEPLSIKAGEVTWAKVTLRKATAKDETSISGTVTDEDGNPVAGASMRLAIYRSNGYFDTPATQSATTDAQGRYLFTGITFQPYQITVSKTGYTHSFAELTPSTRGPAASPPDGDASAGTRPSTSNVLTMKTPWAKGGERTSDSDHADFVLAYPRAITVDYEYQVENKFTGQNVTKGLVWNVGRGMIFSEGLSGRQSRDLELESKGGDPFFRHFYVRGAGHGHYDLGEVPFDSVKEIDEAKADVRRDSPCVVNHVYGVRTFQGNYAKFVVRSIDVVRPQ